MISTKNENEIQLENDIELSNIHTNYSKLNHSNKIKLLSQIITNTDYKNLQFISSLILPKLKNDFLVYKTNQKNLPCELGFKILEYLDIRSIMRCSAVSKPWNNLIYGNGAELAIWKKRLVSENFATEDQTSSIDYLNEYIAKINSSTNNSLIKLPIKNQSKKIYNHPKIMYSDPQILHSDQIVL